MKKFLILFFLSAFTLAVFGQRLSLNVGLAGNNNDSFESGLSYGLQGDFLPLNESRSVWLSVLSQSKYHKVFGLDEKFNTTNLAFGVNLISGNVEGAIHTGVSLNKFPSFSISDGQYLMMYEIENSIGFVLGTNIQYNFWLSEKAALFIQAASGLNIFKTDETYFYYDIQDNIILESYNGNYNLVEVVLSAGFKWKLGE
jgi:hypothetical protein